jgi:hypothetical protein
MEFAWRDFAGPFHSVVKRHPLAKAAIAMNTEENAMKMNGLLYRAGLGVAALIVAGFNIAASIAADVSPDSIKLAPGVVTAPGYETPATSYIVANATNVYSDHSVYGTKVMGELKRGEHVDVLAKVKGWEWVLVGKNGTGIGYVSISMLSPADKYIP